MSDSPQRPAAPESGTDIPTYEQAVADPEIAALLEFEPIAIQPRVNGWNADAQRAFIAMLAITGSKKHAADAIGRDERRVDQLVVRPDGSPFAEAVDRALELHRVRNSGWLADTVAAAQRDDPNVEAPGQVLNEYGEWEDADSYARREEEARESVVNKLLRIRRLYLQEISASSAKRAAFEILTNLPIDWDKAERGEEQEDEPYRTSNQRKPDMVLLAESGWSFGHWGYGPDRMAEQRAAIDEWCEENGREPVEWSE